MTVLYCVASYCIGSMVTGVVVYLGYRFRKEVM
ncbi:hypothetical protein ADEMBY_8 [Bacillus phage Ademby]|nr:hypothetical protein ADEMBY_8 [Bacillus phage Ademby]